MSKRKQPTLESVVWTSLLSESQNVVRDLFQLWQTNKQLAENVTQSHFTQLKALCDLHSENTDRMLVKSLHLRRGYNSDTLYRSLTQRLCVYYEQFDFFLKPGKKSLHEAWMLYIQHDMRQEEYMGTSRPTLREIEMVRFKQYLFTRGVDDMSALNAAKNIDKALSEVYRMTPFKWIQRLLSKKDSPKTVLDVIGDIVI